MEENFSNKNFIEFGELPVICVFINHYSIQVVKVKSVLPAHFYKLPPRDQLNLSKVLLLTSKGETPFLEVWIHPCHVHNNTRDKQ